MPDLDTIEVWLAAHKVIAFAIAWAVIYLGPVLVAKVPWLGPIVAAASAWLAKFTKSTPPAPPAPVSPDAPPSPSPLPSLSPLLAALLEAAKHAIATNQPQLLSKVSALLAEAHSAEQGGAR